jgi:hypothetical protein
VHCAGLPSALIKHMWAPGQGTQDTASVEADMCTCCLADCRGSNVSITGVAVQATSATVGSNGGFVSNSIGSSPAPVVALKTHTAGLNGSLGFWTLGVTIGVSAEFQLQR